jgi:hypothetical protein
MKIQATIKGLEELQAKAGRVENAIPRSICNAINNTADDATKQIGDRTPVGVSGELRKSFHPRYATPSNLTAKVGTHLAPHYGPDVEFGTRPNRRRPPVAALKDWARRKLGDANKAWALARAIGRRGTKGQKMFREGTVNVQSVLDREISSAADEFMDA